ncbi:hypothetical protein GCM10010412_032700 [Nonomuraea recticatena]|uniref:Uncharacterized protein n=1 Tax=Nonomuraea recticatena TaxID=46178 RepID=A0ABN3RTG6_9ACTN
MGDSDRECGEGCERGGRGEHRPRGAFHVGERFGQHQSPLRGRRLGAQTEKSEGGDGESDRGQPEHRVAGYRARDRRQQVAPEDPQLRGAQPALGRQVWCRPGLLQQRRGVHGERGPCHQTDGERGPEDPRPVQRGHHQSGEHRWQGVDHLRRARREPGQEPDDQADEVSGQAHQDGDPHGRQRAVAHAGQHVPSQAVGAQRRVA